MNKLFDIFLEYLKKRWSLLILVLGYAVVYWFIQKSAESPWFIQMIRNPWSWIVAGVLFALSGIVDLARFPQRWRGLWPGGLLIFLGMILTAAGSWQLILPPPLPNNRFVIAVAEFNPITRDEATKMHASNLRNRIATELQYKIDNRDNIEDAIPLQVTTPDFSVPGVTDYPCNRHKEAIRLCKGRAHAIIWGDVRNDEGELTVYPFITFARDVHGASITEGGWRRESFVSDKPSHLDLKRRAAKEITDMVTLVLGLAYYYNGSWDKAISFFAHVPLDEGKLYKGLCLYEKAQGSKDPERDLEDAIQAYDRILPLNFKEQADSLGWIAYLSRANALAALATIGSSSSSRESHSRLREAVEAYQAALRVYNEQELPREWAAIQNKLGVAQGELGKRIPGEEGNKLLREAVEAYQAALRVYNEQELPREWAAIQNKLGVAQGELGKRIPGEEGNKLLREAVKPYQAALRVYNEQELPREWAAIQNNLGVAQGELGKRIPGEEGNKLLREAMGACQAALRICTKRDRQWAAIQDTLGVVKGELGKRIPGEEGKRHINEALTHFDNALSGFGSMNYPEVRTEILANKSAVIRFKKSLGGNGG